VTSDTTFKIKRSKVNLQGAGAFCGGLSHSLLLKHLLHQRNDDVILILILTAFLVRPFRKAMGALQVN